MARTTHTLERLHAIRRDLDNLRGFALRMENSLQQELQAMSREAGAGQDIGTADIRQLPGALPWLYRGSALLTILGFFEHNLNAVCDCLRDESGTDPRITDLAGRGLRRAKLYLNRHIGIDFPADTGTWSRVLKYAEVRNLIAHRDSLVKADDPDLLRFIQEDRHLDIDDSGRVRLHEGALSAVIDELQDFFAELEAAIGNRAGK